MRSEIRRKEANLAGDRGEGPVEASARARDQRIIQMEFTERASCPRAGSKLGEWVVRDVPTTLFLPYARVHLIPFRCCSPHYAAWISGQAGVKPSIVLREN